MHAGKSLCECERLRRRPVRIKKFTLHCIFFLLTFSFSGEKNVEVKCGDGRQGAQSPVEGGHALNKEPEMSLWYKNKKQVINAATYRPVGRSAKINTQRAISTHNVRVGGIARRAGGGGEYGT